MNHDIIKNVIFDQHEVIRSFDIVARDYDLEPGANYVITGLRRAGKTTLLYGVVQDLVAQGVDWSRIVYVNFEDERLAEFALDDFNDLLLVQAELSDEPGYFFLDEVQNVEGWERFARRLADAKVRTYITGSNARMLSSDIEARLGGRYLTLCVTPYRFDEYLRAVGQAYDERALHTTRQLGRIQSCFDEYLHDGGFPEAVPLRLRRRYVESVYQKVLLGDVALRHNVRNAKALRLLVKKLAETVCSEVSFSTLHGMVRAVGVSVSKDSIIDYVSYLQEAYLIFPTYNAVAKFSEREGTPRHYFADNGLLNLFLTDKDSALLENVVACALRDAFGDLWYLKSPKTGIDVDFYLPGQGLAVQVALSIAGGAYDREVSSLERLAERGDAARLVIVTKDEERRIGTAAGLPIEVVPAAKFLLELRS